MSGIVKTRCFYSFSINSQSELKKFSAPSLDIYRDKLAMKFNKGFMMDCLSWGSHNFLWKTVIWTRLFFKHHRVLSLKIKIKPFFFYQGFLSRTMTTHRTAGVGRGSSFIPLYHFHPLTNIQTFISNFAREMTIRYF